jgi:hypothetical protein
VVATAPFYLLTHYMGAATPKFWIGASDSPILRGASSVSTVLDAPHRLRTPTRNAMQLRRRNPTLWRWIGRALLHGITDDANELRLLTLQQVLERQRDRAFTGAGVEKTSTAVAGLPAARFSTRIKGLRGPGPA